MNEDALKLTIYFGERSRAGSGFLADAFTNIYERHELKTSVLLRGVAGYGAKQHLRTDRQLTLSEDLPLVSVAVDTREKMERVVEEIRAFEIDGLVTTERARLVSGPVELAGQAKLTVYLGRRSGPGYRDVVDRLHAAGVAGATVLLGVDGTADGLRQRARFFGRNAAVPLMVISVGDGDRIAEVLPQLNDVIATVERVHVLKRDGTRLAVPEAVDAALQKLMVYSRGQPHLLHRLRHAGAAGATSLRGMWGYHGDHAPHGDSFLQLRRRAPVVTVIVDTPDRIARWFEIVDELTTETGLVTSEMIPAAPLA